jgi:hypothetical protein
MTLLDAMILVGATGVTLWIYRRLVNREVIPTSLQIDDVLDAARRIQSLLPCAVAWTIAVLVLSLRHPRPRLRNLSKQPGFVACLTASAVVLIGVPIGVISQCFIHVATGHSVSGIDWESAGLFSLGGLTGRISIAVAAAWAVQAVCGRWRPKPTWIDRLGRATGFLWITLLPIHELAGVGCLGS